MKNKQTITIITALLILVGLALGIYNILSSSSKNTIPGESLVNSITTQENVRINEVDFYLYKSKYQSVLRGQATYLNHGETYILKNGFMGATTLLKVNGTKLSTPMDPEPLKDISIDSKEAKDRISKDYMIAADPLKSLKGKNFKKINETTYLYQGKCFNQITSCLTEKTVIKFNSKFLPLTITRTLILENGTDYFTSSIDYANFQL